ncbi:MAG: hypothetical protein U9Q94_01110 [Candidatus Bipolaricaulota bacterium]|nr:hypothetical protein [Candidatus Bipolaricaulota bacterium]
MGQLCGIPEVVEHDLGGYLVPVGDVDQMATDVVRLLSDCDLWESSSVAGRKRAVKSFSYERIVPQYEAIYERVLSH